MRSWFNRRPRTFTAPQALPGGVVKVVTDLDRLISEPVGFRWKGKIHLINPMKNKTFLSVLGELARMDAIYKSGNRDEKVILQTYTRLFATVCDTITYADVEEMSNAQVTALFQQIMECVKGHSQVEEPQKKTLPAQATA